MFVIAFCCYFPSEDLASFKIKRRPRPVGRIQGRQFCLGVRGLATPQIWGRGSQGVVGVVDGS